MSHPPRCTHCPICEIKIDGIPLERQQREIILQILIFSVRSWLRKKLLEIDKNPNLYFGYSDRGFGMDFSVRT